MGTWAPRRICRVLGRGRVGIEASRARGGARLAGRAGRLPARGSPVPALWGSAAEAPAHCTLRPLPDDPAGPRGARASGGGASGSGARSVSARARARRRGRRPCPSGPRARGPYGAGAAGAGAGIRTPRTPAAGSTWTLGRGGTGASPPRVGEGVLQPGSPFSAAQSLGK